MQIRFGAWRLALAAALLAGVTANVFGLERSHSKVLAAFRDVVSTPSKSTARIYCDGRTAALGAVVGADGLILTKSSELKGKIECQLQDGRKLPADVVGRDSTLDLALLQVDAKDLPAIRWAKSSDALVGNWVVTTSLEREPAAIGVLSVGPRKIAAPSGALGVQLENDDQVARIAEVVDDSAANRAGLVAGDVIIEVNGKKMKGRQQLVETIRGYMPGEQVKLLVKRKDEQLKLNITLGSLATLVHGDRADFQNNLGGPLSERRAGFTSVIQHDTVLRPSDCGGPLINLDGEAIGINIARAGRVESYALTADVVRDSLEKMVKDRRQPESPPNFVDKSTESLDKKVQ